MEVWDTFNGKATKLGNVFNKTIDQTFTVTANGAHQMTVQDVGGAPNYAVLHKEVTNYTVSSTYGVFVGTPANNSTQSRLVPLSAFAVEPGSAASIAGIDHLEVWNGSTKIGDSPKGTVLNQWYEFAPGKYTLTVEDVSGGGQVLHTSKVTFTVSSSLGVFVNTPANNSTWPTTTVPINGSSTPLVYQLQVWDNTHGVKLGESVTGVGLNSVFMNQSVTFPGPGTYQLAIEDIDPNNGYKSIHTTYVNVTVK
jgi:hypothetical protein